MMVVEFGVLYQKEGGRGHEAKNAGILGRGKVMDHLLGLLEVMQLC